jgi:hypothetical protein
MNPRTIKIDEVEYVRKSDVENGQPAIDVDGLIYSIVRCHDAGVHAGFVKQIDGRRVTLLKSRRLWRWNSHDNTLSGISIKGPYSAAECKFGDEVGHIDLLEACEIIHCTREAMDIIRAVPQNKFGGTK